MARFDPTDQEWVVISPLLPNKPRGVLREDDRRVLNGLARSAGALRPLHDGLQPLQPMGQGRRLAAHFRSLGRALAGIRCI